MSYKPIHDYGLIGDMNSAALVGLDGSIDWACFPRFDSPSVFAALLDDVKGGRFSVSPTERFTSEQRYRPDTVVLETTFTTDGGRVTVIDFMTNALVHRGEVPHEIVRMVRGDAGRVRMRAVFQPRLDYARGETTLRLESGRVQARCENQTMTLLAELPFTIELADDGQEQARAEFDVAQGQSVELVAVYGEAAARAIRPEQLQEKLTRAEEMGQAIVAGLRYEGRWRDQIVRSVLTLHLLTYDPTGAIVAAPTTSLPEFIGGERNWDYRFSWLRDSAWTVGVLYRLGDAREGEEYVEWLLEQCWLGVEEMQILHGISDESDLREISLDHLEGYRGSAPVRIGNGAAFHRQLDVFGEIVLSLATYHKYHGPLNDDSWALVTRVADLAALSWELPDNGMWEVRGHQRHFVSSKVMCWVALDRAAHLAELRGLDAKAAEWRLVAERVHADVLAKGWSEEKQAFAQSYGSDVLDASALLIPFLGFLPNDDPRVRSTVRAIQRELAEGPFVRRYLPEEADDGFTDGEGAFFILSFWMIGALLSIGEQEEGRRLFDALIEKANHLGLFAEMWDPSSGQALGNFPQAFSHIGFIHTARNLSGIAEAPGEVIG